MIYLGFLVFAILFVAYANGANDNFKGVATLFGSGTTGYRGALAWGTLTTFAGSVTAVVLSATLVAKFSGKGLVPDALVGSPHFVGAVALGAALTVILATLLSFPISTTHALTGALVGAGMVQAHGQVTFSVLGKAFFLPLLVSPVASMVLAFVLYPTLHGLRKLVGLRRETCVCVEQKYENQGIGLKLMQFTENQARSAGAVELFCLSTQAFNYFVQKGGFHLGTPDDLPPARRAAYERSGRRSQVLVKKL